MLRWTTRISYFLALMLIASFALGQTEFSAEIVDLQKPGTPTKIYFAKDKIRIEPQATNSRGAGVIIVNLATQTSTVLMTQQHMYMEMPAQGLSQRGVFLFFRAGDIENACVDWQKMVRTLTGSCRKVGNDTVNGRTTVEYEGTSSSGRLAVSGWILSCGFR